MAAKGVCCCDGGDSAQSKFKKLFCRQLNPTNAPVFDGIVVTAVSFWMLNCLLEEMCNHSKESDYPHRNKWIKNAFCPNYNIHLDGKFIELVHQYVYGGQQLTN